MAAQLEVIDWDEAMEQCGDDEEFLRELLDDLRGEADTQLTKIEEIIAVSTMPYIFYTSRNEPHTSSLRVLRIQEIIRLRK